MAGALYAIYGVSGAGRGVMPLARDMLAAGNMEDGAALVFVDDQPPAQTINGQPVLTYQQFLDEPSPAKNICIAIADSKLRQQLAERCAQDRISFFSITAQNVVVMDSVEMGEGGILSPFVTLTSNIKIGRHFHANLYSYVEHDCVIGDFVTFAPGVQCNGNVVIEDHAYIGAGAVIKQGSPENPLVIGSQAVVGMGAVVTKSVPSQTTVAGCPARPME